MTIFFGHSSSQIGGIKTQANMYEVLTGLQKDSRITFLNSLAPSDPTILYLVNLKKVQTGQQCLICCNLYSNHLTKSWRMAFQLSNYWLWLATFSYILISSSKPNQPGKVEACLQIFELSFSLIVSTLKFVTTFKTTLRNEFGRKAIIDTSRTLLVRLKGTSKFARL